MRSHQNRHLQPAFAFGLPLLAGLVLALAAAAPARSQQLHRFDQEGILGTSYQLSVWTTSEDAARDANTAAQAEIERLSAILNLYDPDSEISRLNTSAGGAVSAELFAVLEACETWRQQTDGAFSCRLGRIVEIWRQADATNAAPDRGELRLLAGRIRRAELALDPAGRTVERPDDVVFSTDGLAKGYIIDRALEAAAGAAPQATGLLLNIGGDMRSRGTPGSRTDWSVEIAGSTQQPVRLAAGTAVATSGSGPRDLEIGHLRYTHIVSAESGWADDRVLTATVRAPDALTADALATAFVAIPTQAALDLANRLDGVDTIIRTQDGREYVSAAWRPDVAAPADAAGAASPFRLSVDYEIPRMQAASYRAPYLAIWVTDEDRQLVRTLATLGDQMRWREEIYVWWRRYGRRVPDLVDAMSEPTRRPGRYHFVWDGFDDFGEPVPPGDYTLHIETAREHGDHALTSIDLELADAPVEIEQAGEGELGRIALEYRRSPS